jgi:hypothetical protein
MRFHPVAPTTAVPVLLVALMITTQAPLPVLAHLTVKLYPKAERLDCYQSDTSSHTTESNPSMITLRYYLHPPWADHTNRGDVSALAEGREYQDDLLHGVRAYAFHFDYKRNPGDFRRRQQLLGKQNLQFPPTAAAGQSDLHADEEYPLLEGTDWHHVTFSRSSPGTTFICILNEGSHYRKVDLTLESHLRSPWERNKPVNPIRAAIEETLSRNSDGYEAQDSDIPQLEEGLEDLSAALLEIAETEGEEAEHRRGFGSTAVDTYRRVVWLTSFNMLVLVVATIAQTQHLRRFFREKKIV